MNRLIIYNSGGTAAQIKAAADCFYKYSDATIKDVNSVTTGDITTYIGTLTDAYYHAIFICCTTQANAASSLLSFNQVAALRAKMAAGYEGTVVDSGTCQANATVTEIVLASTASASDDTYNGMFIETTGITAVLRYISDYVGNTRACTTTTTTTAITTTETYEVYTNDYIYELGNTNATTGKTACLQAWDVLYPDAQYPLVNHYIGGYLFAMASGTASAAAAGTITIAATITVGDRTSQTNHDVDDYYKDMFVYIYSATTGAAQYAKIAAYNATSRVCTLSENWGIKPTGTIVYRIIDNTSEAFYDKATELMVKTYMYDIDSAVSMATNKRLIDLYGSLAITGTDEPTQDLTYLWNDFLYRGKAIFTADALGVV
jgi:hypothetical protein